MTSKSAVQIRPVTPEEEAWVNKVYEQVKFLPSNFAKETVLVADLSGELMGVGRLVPVGEGVLELGGMYVAPEARGHGIARAIVSRLIEEAEGHKLFCIPFESKLQLYQDLGFMPYKGDRKTLPIKLQEKYNYCATSYTEKMHLLEWHG